MSAFGLDRHLLLVRTECKAEPPKTKLGGGWTMHRIDSMDFVANNWVFILILALFVGMHLIRFSSGERKGRKAGLTIEQPRLAPSVKPRGPSRRRLKLRLGSALDRIHSGIISKGDEG